MHVMDLADVVQEQMTLVMPLVDASVSIEIRTEGALFVKCSSDVISNILINLVVNARDAMPDGGKILIEVACSPFVPPVANEEKNAGSQDYVCLSVTDTGEGMPPELLKKIFDPFFTTKLTGKGTGLGLSMVFGQVREMGGHIDVNSSPGEGTSMLIYLPVSDELPDKRISADGLDPDTMRFEGYTALIVEDEPDLLELMCNFMASRGFDVLRAENGNDALVVQDDHDGDIDLMLTDIIMPQMDGVKLWELISSLRPEMKTIFMSGYPSGAEMSKLILPKAACLMAKPVDQSKLMTTIYSVLNGEPGTSDSGAAAHWAVNDAADDMKQEIERE
jgi:CheY-like chemotaxis protein